jgi:hypothetical protein
VIGCPCANPPSGPGRGCDNSAGTGGAILSAAGVAYLSADSLVFTTSGEKPTATSVLLQGTSSPAAGVVYGQGVRCVGGTLKRLYSKNAVAGNVAAPQGAELSISMFDAMADWMTVPLLHHDYAGKAPTRTGLEHPSISPYRTYESADGVPVLLLRAK